MTAVAVCRSYHVPILARGGGTSLVGQACDVAVVIDFSKYMNTILEMDSDRKPGLRMDQDRVRADLGRSSNRPTPC